MSKAKKTQRKPRDEKPVDPKTAEFHAIQDRRKAVRARLCERLGINVDDEAEIAEAGPARFCGRVGIFLGLDTAERIDELLRGSVGMREALQKCYVAFGDETIVNGPKNGQGQYYAIGVAASVALALDLPHLLAFAAPGHAEASAAGSVVGSAPSVAEHGGSDRNAVSGGGYGRWFDTLPSDAARRLATGSTLDRAEALAELLTREVRGLVLDERNAAAKSRRAGA